MITITRAVQTSFACPSQWDAWDADGNYYYLRYRSGCGRVQHFPGGPAFWERPDEKGELVSSFEFGDEYNGTLTLEEFATHAQLDLAPDVKTTSYNQYFAQQLKSALAEAAEQEKP